MNRTQRITSDWLLQCGLVGDELLLEALLRRGFLAYRDDQGVWLGTGSHPADLGVLRLVDGLEVEPLSGHKDRMAQIKLQSPDVPEMGIASAIVALPENHFEGHSLWTGGGVSGYVQSTWSRYKNMGWGARLATCPMQERGHPRVNNALDLGVALLVKVFPLARVATGFSCDGHGERPASISFHFEWDSQWGKAVFDALHNPTPGSTWTWGSGVTIAPHGGFSDAKVLGMLDDIQHCARQLLHQRTIDNIGRARARTLEALGESSPNVERFAKVARCQLAEGFA